MKKSVSALALIAAVALGTIGLTMGNAGAHTADMGYDCFTVTVHFERFASNPPGSGANTATISINGVKHDITFTTASHTAEVPFVSHSGDPDVLVTVSFVGLDGTKGNDSATFPADDCAPPPTPPTPAPTTTTVGVAVAPAVVTRGVVAAPAVVASPAFTG